MIIDLWAERRAELAELLEQLTPEQALEVLQTVVRECERGADLGAYLSGTIEGMANRR